MTNKPRLFVVLCVACVVALALTSPRIARAQAASTEKAPVYTYVSEWTVPRAMWGDYLKQSSGDDELMKKAVADGTLIEFGDYTVLNHQEGLPTHGTWFSASSIANLMKALEELRTRPGATSAPFAASKHWDYILRSTDYDAHSGTFTNGYLRVGNWRFAKDASDGGAVVKATLSAALQKMMSEGSLHEYAIDEEAVHSRDPGTIFVAIVTNGAEGLDKFEAAIDAMEKSSPAVGAALRGTLDPEGHRDFLAKVDTMTHK